MQDGENHGANRSRPSLNAVRAFVAAARLGSLKAAAADLGVTAGAVGHHVKQLEAEIGKPLFVRRNNSIQLTRDGKQLFDAVAPALKTIARASDAIRKEADVVTMNISTSLAQLWLVPRLVEFRTRHPKIVVDMETERRPVVLDESQDLAVSFSRSGPPDLSAVRLLTEKAIPMATPAYRRKARAPDDRIETAPLISSTRDDWEWRAWAGVNAIDFAQLNIRYRFDTDSPAILACNAGLGVMLMPDWAVDWNAGIVEPFGTYRHQTLGAYWLSRDARIRPAAKLFASWLLRVAREAEAAKNQALNRILRLEVERGGAEAPPRRPAASRKRKGA